jgi:tetratricopeptide (TPR) repeat protein
LLSTLAFVPQALADAQTECSKWQTTPPERSIIVCTQVLQRQPRLDWAVLNRGWAHYKLRHYDEAIADFTRVLVITPKQTKAYFNRARAYVEKGDNLRAVADYTRILNLDPLSDFALSVRGWVLTKLLVTGQMLAETPSARSRSSPATPTHSTYAVSWPKRREEPSRHSRTLPALLPWVSFSPWHTSSGLRPIVHAEMNR